MRFKILHMDNSLGNRATKGGHTGKTGIGLDVEEVLDLRRQTRQPVRGWSSMIEGRRLLSVQDRKKMHLFLEQPTAGA